VLYGNNKSDEKGNGKDCERRIVLFGMRYFDYLFHVSHLRYDFSQLYDVERGYEYYGKALVVKSFL
jgi:hypothetical protein